MRPLPLLATAGAENWTDEKIEAKAKQVGAAAFKGIKGAMKWQPSLQLPPPKLKKDMFKQKKITVDEMENSVGLPTASVRYDSLSITGTTVTLHWSADDITIKLNGTYGRGY
ncbi:hypothetical protein JCM8547_007218 [Rhodosporidiobolus lusitaniae]